MAISAFPSSSQFCNTCSACILCVILVYYIHMYMYLYCDISRTCSCGAVMCNSFAVLNYSVMNVRLRSDATTTDTLHKHPLYMYIYANVCLSFYPSVSLCVGLSWSVSLSVCLFCPSFCLSVYLSVCLLRVIFASYKQSNLCINCLLVLVSSCTSTMQRL